MSLSHSPKITTSGLVCCLDANDPKSYNGSGSTWFDRSGNGNNGTMLNMTFAEKTMVFNGSNGQVNTDVTLNKDEGTIACWFKIDVQKNYNTIFDNALGANDWEMWIYVDGRLRFRTSANQTDILMTVNDIQINTWYHMILTWDQSNGYIYMNGEQAVSDVAAPANRTTPTQLRIGGSINTRLDGNMGAFWIYNNALTSGEVKQNYNATKGRFGL